MEEEKLPCAEVKCAEKLTLEEGPDEIECNIPRDIMKEKCFLPRKKEEEFYYHTPAHKLSKEALGELFEEFAVSLGDEEIMRPCYTYFAIVTTRPIIKFKYLNNDNHQHCNDIIAKFYIEKTAGKGGSKDLFHIALHPRLPVYKRSTRRSLSGCGFYEKKGGDGGGGGGGGPPAAPPDTGSGAFHYKVENIMWGTSGTGLRSDKGQQPYKKFHVDKDFGSIFKVDHSNFKNVDNDAIRKAYKLDEAGLSNEQIEERLSFHKKIYDLFVEAWRNYIHPDLKHSSKRDISSINTPSKSLEENAIRLLSGTRRTHEGGKLKIKRKFKTQRRRRHHK